MMFMATQQRDHFYKNLEQLCSAYGAVTALAQQLGIHRVTMSKIVHGHEDITMSQAEAIAAYYGVSLSDMLLAPKKFQKTSAAS